MKNSLLAVSNSLRPVAGIAISVACMLLACFSEAKANHKVHPAYLKDDPTNLCFAVWYDTGTDSRSITEVPCSFSVQSLIVEEK